MVERSEGQNCGTVKKDDFLNLFFKKRKKKCRAVQHSLLASSTEQDQPGRAAPLSVSQGGMHCNDTAEQSATTRLGSGR